MTQIPEAGLDILISRPYLQERYWPVIERGQSMGMNLLVDCGAYTAWKKGIVYTVDDYCDWLDGLDWQPWRYIQLDVLADHETTRANLCRMQDRGFDPIPVFTRGAPPDYLAELAQDHDLIAVGVGVQSRGNREFLKFVETECRPDGANVHWFGFTDHDWITTFKPFSCDTSAWSSWTRYGTGSIYLGRGRMRKTGRGRRLTSDMVRALRRQGLDVPYIASPDFWKTNDKDAWDERAIVGLSSYISYAADVRRQLGTRLFIATEGVMVYVAMMAYDRLLGQPWFAAGQPQ